MKKLLFITILTLSMLQAKTITVCDPETGECKILIIYGDKE